MSETVSTDTTKPSGKKPDHAPKKKSWFAGIKAELKKVIWPDRQTIFKSTTAVVLVSIFISVVVKVSDLIIQAVLDLLI